MTTGNMLFGPLELVSLATPSGTPLRLTITYNSRNLHKGALGIGWTLNTEQHISTPKTLPTYWSALNTSSEFTPPTAAAADERLPMLPNTAQMSRALDGANMGFYLANAGNPIQSCPAQLLCPPTAALEPRVVFEDGSTALFNESGAFTGLRDLAGNEQLYFSPPPGPVLLPMSSGLRQRARSVALQFDAATRPSSANVVATIGASNTMVSRVLVDTAGFLTDICAPANPLNTSDCLRAPEKTDACRALGQGLRTLYRFQYGAAQHDPAASPTKRLTDVTDEACKVVEHHDYDALGALGVVATTSDSASESLSFLFNNERVPRLVSSVVVTTFLAPTSVAPPVGNQQATFVKSPRTIDDGVKRVGTVADGCGCGTSTNRTWATSVDGAPRIRVLDQGLTHSEFSYGDPLLDPHNFNRPVRETRRDQFPGTWLASPPIVLTFAYQHPLVRRPTVTTQPANITWEKTSTFDYDDDDDAHPCRDGFTPGPPSGPPNTAPTRFLCRVSDGSRVTHFHYDSQGRLTGSEGPDGVPVKLVYYPDDDSDELRAGLLKSMTRGSDALALTTTFDRYHFTGRPTRIINANGEVTNSEFDVQGRLTRTEAPDLAVTLIEYAAGNKPAKVTLPSKVRLNAFCVNAMG